MRSARRQQPACYDCGRAYGDDCGFPDLWLPDEVWRVISPDGEGNGLLCPSCICRRAALAGVRCPAVFRSGPFAECHVSEVCEWTEFDGNDRVFSCRIRIVPENEGGFSVFAADLPGIASQGDTISECVENITEALKAAIGYYLDEGMEIPWAKADIEHDREAVEKVILVHA